MYREENMPGKGIGCIAVKEIKKRRLVLMEFLQLFNPSDEQISRDPNIPMPQEFLKIAEGVMKSFLGISK